MQCTLYSAQQNCYCFLTHTVHADLLKANFFARPIFPFKSFAQTKWPKNQHKNWKLTQKMWNSAKLCIFAFKNPNLAQSLKTFAQPCGRMVAAFRSSDLYYYIFWKYFPKYTDNPNVMKCEMCLALNPCFEECCPALIIPKRPAYILYFHCIGGYTSRWETYTNDHLVYKWWPKIP